MTVYHTLQEVSLCVHSTVPYFASSCLVRGVQDLHGGGRGSAAAQLCSRRRLQRLRHAALRARRALSQRALRLLLAHLQ